MSNEKHDAEDNWRRACAGWGRDPVVYAAELAADQQRRDERAKQERITRARAHADEAARELASLETT